jgi:nitronate monooxygenase
MTVLEDMTTPIIAAPMAGGPSTPALARAVGAAGGLGFLALGTTTVDDAARQMAEMEGPVAYGANLFAPQQPLAEPEQVDALAQQLDLTAPDVTEVDYTNGWAQKLSAVFAAVEAGRGPAVVSSTFGAFSGDEVARLHAVGVEAWVGVATPEDAVVAERLGVDALVVQGPEAGGHRFTWSVEKEPDQRPLPELLHAVRAAGVRLPLIASGGITAPEDVRSALKIDGVVAVSCGTAFLLAEEAGTSGHNRALLMRGGETVSTRAFSGRYARGLATEFTRRHLDVPPVYPYVNRMLAQWRATGDEAVAYCLAGVGVGDVRSGPAAGVVDMLANG